MKERIKLHEQYLKSEIKDIRKFLPELLTAIERQRGVDDAEELVDECILTLEGEIGEAIDTMEEMNDQVEEEKSINAEFLVDFIIRVDEIINYGNREQKDIFLESISGCSTLEDLSLIITGV